MEQMKRSNYKNNEKMEKEQRRFSHRSPRERFFLSRDNREKIMVRLCQKVVTFFNVMHGYKVLLVCFEALQSIRLHTISRKLCQETEKIYRYYKGEHILVKSRGEKDNAQALDFIEIK